jgi:hypothetical protein
MRSFESIPRMKEEEIKENGGWVSLSMIYLIYCKSHSVPLSSTIIKKCSNKNLQGRKKKLNTFKATPRFQISLSFNS